MKPERPKFNKKNPVKKDEKLICELTMSLDETMKAFIRLNKFEVFDKELFIILRDSALAYAGQTIEMLARMLADKTQIPDFVKEAHDIFNCYLQEVRDL